MFLMRVQTRLYDMDIIDRLTFILSFIFDIYGADDSDERHVIDLLMFMCSADMCFNSRYDIVMRLLTCGGCRMRYVSEIHDWTDSL